MEKIPNQDNIKLSLEKSLRDCMFIREKTTAFIKLFDGIDVTPDGDMDTFSDGAPLAGINMVNTFRDATESFLFRKLKETLEKKLGKNPSQADINIVFSAVNHLRNVQPLLWQFEEHGDLLITNLETLQAAVSNTEVFDEEVVKTLGIVFIHAQLINKHLAEIEVDLKKMVG
jgi:hypothetical protein